MFRPLALCTTPLATPLVEITKKNPKKIQFLAVNAGGAHVFTVLGSISPQTISDKYHSV